MRKIIVLTAVALGLSGGVALADGRSSPAPTVRDHRGGSFGGSSYQQRYGSTGRGASSGGGYGSVHGGAQSPINRGGPSSVRGGVTVRSRAPIYARDGLFHFDGGAVRLVRPRLNVRYTNYYQRPASIVQSYQPVAGYVWVGGDWQWNGAQWIWIDGHYEVDPAYASTSTLY